MKFTDYDLETLNKLQNMELMILKDFIKICAENNLIYYMYGGQLIGVIRHEGFIPWDDDIDVIMFREDYEKFKEIFLSSHSEKYELLSDETVMSYLPLDIDIETEIARKKEQNEDIMIDAMQRINQVKQNKNNNDEEKNSGKEEEIVV